MKLRIGLVLAGALAVVVSGCAAGGGGGASTEAVIPTAGGEVLAQGERPREDQYTRSAIDHLEQAEEAETPEAAAPHLRAAVEAAQQAIDADARNPRGWYLQGLAYIGLDEYVEADRALTRAEELRPIYQIETESIREQAWIQAYQQAAPLVNEGRYAEAVPIFERANAIYQGRPEVMFMLGNLYTQLDEPGKAVDNLQAARELIESDRIEDMDSTTQASWREQAEQIPVLITQALMQSGDFPAAIQAIRGLLADDPDNVGYMQNLASLYIQLEQPDSARAIYDRIAARSGLTNVDHYQIGVGLYQMEDFEGAAEAFGRAATASPMDRDAVEMQARSLQIAHSPGSEGDDTPRPVLERLRTAAAQWVELDPNNRNAYLVLAQTENRLGNSVRAGELVDAIEDLSVLMQTLELQRYREGGGVVAGVIQNVSLETGSTLTLTVDFYDVRGTRIGSQQTQIQVPAPDNTAAFQVTLDSQQLIGGYGYTLGN
jgi:tetratricopeptide (TPR) repeat protein